MPSIRPFLRLILAYIGSALHSLDPDIRYDGCVALESLCHSYQSLFRDAAAAASAGSTGAGMSGGSSGSRSTEMDIILLTLQGTIPAFTILLDDVSGGLASMSRRGVGSLSMMAGDPNHDDHDHHHHHHGNHKKKSSKNRPKRKGSTTPRAVGVLKSFRALMRITTLCHYGYDILVEDSGSSNSNMDEDDDASNTNTNGNGNGNGETIHDHAANSTVSPAEFQSKAMLPSTSRSDLEFTKGGRTSNAIVWKKDQIRHVAKLKLLGHLGNWTNVSGQGSDHPKDSSDHAHTSTLNVKVQLALFSKLRDRLVEVTQRGQPADRGIYLPPTHAQECSLVISTLRLLWNGYSRQLLQNNNNNNNKKKNGRTAEDHDANMKKIKHIATSVLNLFLESFSIQDTSGNESNRHVYDSLNASICLALSEFGSVLDTLSGHHASVQDAQWVKAIFSHVSPHLVEQDATERHESQQASSSISQTATASNTRVTLIKVVERLLLLLPDHDAHDEHDASSTCLLSEKRYMDLLGRFGGLYFSPINFNDVICKSPEGRRAAALLVSLINQYIAQNGGFHKNKVDTMGPVLLQMSSLLPTYLMKWRGNFPKDSTVVLATLLAMSRNCNTDHSEGLDRMDSSPTSPPFDSNAFCSLLRSSIEKLFRTSKNERKVGASGTKIKLSVFEELPRAAQTILISIVGTLRFPSDTCMTYLSQICARRLQSKGGSTNVALLDDAMVDYIMGVMRATSRTMTLQQYLTFLINSCGINNATYSPKEIASDDNQVVFEDDFDFAFSYDQAISRMCRYTLLTKSNKVINSYKPILKAWLETSVEEGKVMQLLKSRAAISILSCQALSYEVGDYESEQTIFHQKDVRVCLCQAIYNIFQSLAIGKENTDDCQKLSDLQKRRFMTPIVALLRSVPFLMTDLVDSIVQTIQSSGEDVLDRECLIHSLIYLVKTKSLASFLREISTPLQSAIKIIDDNTSSSGSLHAASGMLKAEANALLGFNIQ